MLFYLVNLFLLSIVLAAFRRDRKKMLAVAVIWLGLLGALRGSGIGDDYFMYRMIFRSSHSVGWLSVGKLSIEPGYSILNKVVGIFSNNFQWVLAVCSFLAILGVAYFIKKYSKYPIISIWLYITIGMYQMNFTVMRQSIAISLILFAYRYAVERKPWKFVLMVLLATSFHYTAFVFGIVYFLVNKPILERHKIRDFSLLLLLTFCLPLFRKILEMVLSYTKYRIYIGGRTGEGDSLLFLYFVILLFVCIIGRSKRAEQVPGYSHLYLFCVLTCLTQSFALMIELINRVSLYFSIPMLLLLPNTIDRFDRNSKRIAGSALMVMALGYYIFVMLNPGNSTVMQYSFFFS